MCMSPVCDSEDKGMYVVCDWICISALWGRYGCAHSYIRLSVPVVWTKRGGECHICQGPACPMRPVGGHLMV